MARDLVKEVRQRVVNTLVDLAHEMWADGVDGVLPAEHIAVAINGDGTVLKIYFFGEVPPDEAIVEASEPEMVDESPTVILDPPPVTSKKKQGG